MRKTQIKTINDVYAGVELLDACCDEYCDGRDGVCHVLDEKAFDNLMRSLVNKADAYLFHTDRSNWMQDSAMFSFVKANDLANWWLKIRNEYHLHFKETSGKMLKVVYSSHDIPCGSTFEIIALSPKEVEKFSELIDDDFEKLNKYYTRHFKTLLAN